MQKMSQNEFLGILLSLVCSFGPIVHVLINRNDCQVLTNGNQDVGKGY